MGLTHYWQRESELNRNAFRKFVADCKWATGSLEIALAGGNGTGKPIFRPDEVSFNGGGETGCETFYIHRSQFDRRDEGRSFEFTKTNGRPYDVAVKIALICLKHHLKDAVKISSDDADSQWAEARRICVETVGFGADFKLED
jgi:hypothetical protein